MVTKLNITYSNNNHFLLVTQQRDTERAGRKRCLCLPEREPSLSLTNQNSQQRKKKKEKKTVVLCLPYANFLREIKLPTLTSPGPTFIQKSCRSNPTFANPIGSSTPFPSCPAPPPVPAAPNPNQSSSEVNPKLLWSFMPKFKPSDDCATPNSINGCWCGGATYGAGISADGPAGGMGTGVVG